MSGIYDELVKNEVDAIHVRFSQERDEELPDKGREVLMEDGLDEGMGVFRFSVQSGGTPKPGSDEHLKALLNFIKGKPVTVHDMKTKTAAKVADVKSVLKAKFEETDDQLDERMTIPLTPKKGDKDKEPPRVRGGYAALGPDDKKDKKKKKKKKKEKFGVGRYSGGYENHQLGDIVDQIVEADAG